MSKRLKQNQELRKFLTEVKSILRRDVLILKEFIILKCSELRIHFNKHSSAHGDQLDGVY